MYSFTQLFLHKHKKLKNNKGKKEKKKVPVLMIVRRGKVELEDKS